MNRRILLVMIAALLGWTLLIRTQAVLALEVQRSSEGQVAQVTQAATQLPATPDPRLTPRSLGPEPVPERSPLLIMGGVLVLAVILIGVLINTRQGKTSPDDADNGY
jgi:hypothetical protein